MTEISVIIPVYNDPDGIDTSLESVVNQNYSDYEAIPVDNNSTDHTDAVIQEWETKYPELIRSTQEQEVQSSYAARNAGINIANGEIIVFLDADMSAPQNWLSKIDSAFADQDIDYLGYEVQIKVSDGDKTIWSRYDSAIGLQSQYYFKHSHYVPTCSLAVHERVFDIAGKFKTDRISGGDREFGQRVYQHPELKMALSSEITVTHPARSTFYEHYIKAVRISRGKVQRLKEESSKRDFYRTLGQHLLPPNPLRIYDINRLSDENILWIYSISLLLKYVQAYHLIALLLEDEF